MTGWLQPVRRGWVVRDRVPGPDVDEFAEPDRVIRALAGPGGGRGTLLAVQHPHRTPAALAAGTGLVESLPVAREALAELLRRSYRPVADVVAPYWVDGPDGTAAGLLCMVDPAAVDADGISRVRHSEQVYPDVVAERARVLAGLGVATSAAMLVPVAARDDLTALLDVGSGREPAVSLVDSGGRRHRMWLVGPGEEQDSLLAAAGAHPLLVADGNHRVAAAAAAGLSGLLALITAGPALRIGPIHRALVDTGLTADDLVEAWRGVGLRVDDLPAAVPPEPGVVVVVCPDRVLRVELPVPGVDHAAVESLLLEKALGLDPESPRVKPVTDDRWRSVAADAVLLVAPVPLADVLAVHAAGERMPRKSTYFTPKPRSGLLLADL
ncbi:MAG: DUF1015 family protein [Umezawaea sp.]